MLGLLRKGVKSIAAGKSQADLGIQSPDLPNAVTRIGRFVYVVGGGWILVTWYTTYVNERTQEGVGPSLVIGGSVVNTPDRPNKSPNFNTSPPGTISQNNQAAAASSTGFVSTTNPSGRTLIPLSPSQLGVPGSAVPGYLWSAPNKEKQIPPFNRQTYQALTAVAVKIGGQFGLRITSAYRQDSPGSLHSAGLAFDFVGAMSNMKRAATWASHNPAMFQEIFIHNEGSGVHLHLGMYPNAAAIFHSGVNSMSRPSAARN